MQRIARTHMFGLFCLVTFGTPACQKYNIETQRLRPAPLFAAGYRTVAVATLAGEHGEEAAEVLQGVVVKQGRSTVLDRPRVAAEQVQIGLSGVSATQAQELAQRLGADVVLHGRVQEFRRCATEYVVHEHAKSYPRADGSRDVTPGSGTWTRRANIDLIIDLVLVDVRGVTVGATQVVVRSRAQQESSVWRKFSDIDWESHRTEAFAALPAHMRRQLAPYQEPLVVVLYGMRHVPEAYQAITAVHNGEWTQAIALFREGVRRADNQRKLSIRARAHYNLGIALSFNGEFLEGMCNLKIAEGLKPSAELRHIIAQMGTYAAEAAKAKQQLDILGGRAPFIELTPADEDGVEALDPWIHDNAPTLPSF